MENGQGRKISGCGELIIIMLVEKGQLGSMGELCNRRFWRLTWQMTKGFWQAPGEGRKGLLLFVAIIGLSLLGVYVLVLLNRWYNTFYNTLQQFDLPGFGTALAEFGWLAFCHIVIAVYAFYLQQMLEIKWRRWMTERYVAKWLADDAYYRLQVFEKSTDNPDQRISEDIRLFVNITLRLTVGLVKSLATLVSFLAILWNLSGVFAFEALGRSWSIPGYMVWLAVLYAAAGTWLTDRVGHPLARLNFEQQRLEADFRYSLVRLRENSESVAFYGGEAREQAAFSRRFAAVFNNFWRLMTKQKQLTWFTSGYAQLAVIFPIIMAAPRYFAKEISLGGLMQINSAFGRVQDALSFVVEVYPLLAEWQAVVTRLTGFTADMERIGDRQRQAQPIQITREARDSLAVAALTLTVPAGETLVKDLSLQVERGAALLVKGPSGAGKSTLLRAIAGLWPCGEGQVRLPETGKLLFVPQRAYLPIGTLREALAYPADPAGLDAAQVRAALALARLEELIPILDEEGDWSQILSLGEQQRLAFVRAVLSQPDWLVLDEATSAVDEETEENLYRWVRQALPQAAIISVGHRSVLERFHDQVLELDGNSRFALRTARAC